jgi:hypothetical protein
MGDWSWENATDTDNITVDVKISHAKTATEANRKKVLLRYVSISLVEK